MIRKGRADVKRKACSVVRRCRSISSLCCVGVLFEKRKDGTMVDGTSKGFWRSDVFYYSVEGKNNVKKAAKNTTSKVAVFALSLACCACLLVRESSILRGRYGPASGLS